MKPVSARWRSATVVAWLIGTATGAWGQEPAETFGFRDASLPDAEAGMRACVGLPKVDVKRTLESARSFAGVTETRIGSAPAIIVSQAGQWACVPRTSTGRPVWPLEAMENIASIDGADANDLRTWRLGMLSQLRETGRALGLVKWPNGNAYEVEVELQPGSGVYAKWQSRFLKIGSYEDSAYTVVLTGAGVKSVNSTKVGSGAWNTVVPPRATHWPVVDQWAVLPGTPQTSADRLTGTQWTRNSERMKLEAGGIATSTATSRLSGTWLVKEPGVLRIQWRDGGFDTLRLTADGLQLTGVRRRTQAPIGDAPPAEFQTAAVFELVRTPQASAAAASAPAAPPVAAPAAAAAATTPGMQHIAALLVFERELKALGPASDVDPASLLTEPARALWSPTRVRQLVEPPVDLATLEASVVLTLQKRLAEQLVPRARAAVTGMRAAPDQFADVYLDLAELLIRLSAAQIRVIQRLEGTNKLASDDSGTRAATLLMMQTSLQGMVSANERAIEQVPAPQRARAEARLRQLRTDCADALALAGTLPAPAPAR